MFNLFRKKDLKESEEYAKVIKRIAELTGDIAKLSGQVSSLDAKIEAYRGEVKNVKKKAQEIAAEMELDKNENNISNDFPTLL